MAANQDGTKEAQFLAPEAYLERFARGVTNSNNGLLFLVALLAFWFAIENSYASFQDYVIEKAKLEYNQRDASRIQPSGRESSALLEAKKERLKDLKES